MASLKTLQPWLRDPAEQLFEYGHSLDSRLVVTSALRTHQEQSKLWARCRDGSCGLPVARPGHSMHELGRAFDMARRHVDPHGDELLALLGSIWREAGGTWGADVDPVHFEA